MLRKIIFRVGAVQLTLPVTPESYTVTKGRHVETVNIHEIGDVNLAGGRALGSVVLGCLLPYRGNYPFIIDYRDPESIKGQLTEWMESGATVRFIVSGTSVNEAMLIEQLEIGERDGTNDYYATITLRDAPELPKVETVSAGTGGPREKEATQASAEQSYTAVWGDTLCGICRKFYGTGDLPLAIKLATYNGRPDANILYVGEVLRIPDRSMLGG